ncbi:SLATT domain-containing protein [Streptomyces sp. p1417]|uniref:SLATT domain-containing protein n=1 Tax=Streptomyces typhae TaxID=2681492 RepID=A0A6L6WYH6_9ACTN|nr:SLATT domain-containing protein [Streptomyces typhae]MVO86565.1 SLATT domain-containing protein [Streptomyces typhae]
MRKPRECRVSHHQPEMQPEGVPQEGSGAGDRPPGPLPGDLAGRSFPLGDWGEPADRLDELYRWVERGALDTAAWYLRDRARKRLGARLLRGGAALGAVGAGVLPLLDLAGGVAGAAPWGYVSLLAGVACVGCDRVFGLTSGWMRDMATAQAVQRRLQVLQFDWASESVREVLGPTDGTASEAAERCLGVLRRFSEDVTELVRAETADWMVEFRAGAAPLLMQGAVPGGASGHPREAGPGPGRFPLPPGARPNMPRQRPPEPR